MKEVTIIDCFKLAYDYAEKPSSGLIPEYVFENATKIYKWYHELSDPYSKRNNLTYTESKFAIAEALKRTNTFQDFEKATDKLSQKIEKFNEIRKNEAIGYDEKLRQDMFLDKKDEVDKIVKESQPFSEYETKFSQSEFDYKRQLNESDDLEDDADEVNDLIKHLEDND